MKRVIGVAALKESLDDVHGFFKLLPWRLTEKIGLYTGYGREAMDISEISYYEKDVEQTAHADDSAGDNGEEPQSDVLVIDIANKTRQRYHPSTRIAEQTTEFEGLPEIRPETTRVILRSTPCPRKAAKESKKKKAEEVGSDDARIRQLFQLMERIEILSKLLQGESTRKTMLNYDRWESSSSAPFTEAQTYIFDIWDMQNLWKEALNPHTRPLYLQNNVHESLVADSELLVDFAKAQREKLFFGRHTVEIWQCLSSVQTKFLSDSRLAVICDFTTLPVNFLLDTDANSGPPPTTKRDFSPLKHHFIQILESESSATLIPQKDTTFMSQMVTLDLLRALIECWIVFLTGTHLKASTYASDLDTRSQSYNTSVVRNMARIARDLDLAFQYTMNSAYARLSDGDLQPKALLRAIENEGYAKLRAIKNRVDDFLSNLQSISDVQKSLTQESQEGSIKRLTLLAALFLPLSLASSLLSMGTRAKDLGLLWYDYVGICALMMLCVFIVYQFMHLLDYIRVARATTTASWLDKVKKQTPRGLWALAVFAIDYVTSGKHRTRKWVVMLWIFNYAFIGATVASFWIGMWKDVALGLKIWGYAAAGWGACFFLISVLRLCSFFYHFFPELRRSRLYSRTKKFGQ